MHLYIGETVRHLGARIRKHGQKSTRSHIYEHTSNCKNRTHSLKHDEIKIKNKNFKNYFHHIDCKALFIKFHNPSINVQDNPAILNIF